MANRKVDLIRRLLRERISNDPSAAAFGQTAAFADGLSALELMAFPEATVVTCVETWAQGRAQRRSDADIARLIASFRGVPPLESVEAVIRGCVQREHGHGGFLPGDHVERCITAAKSQYGIS